MTVEPTERLTVVLTAEHWNAVLGIMAEAPMPHRITAPLINEIHRQCIQQGQPVADSGAGVAALRSRANGEAVDETQLQ